MKIQVQEKGLVVFEGHSETLGEDFLLEIFTRVLIHLWGKHGRLEYLDTREGVKITVG